MRYRPINDEPRDRRLGRFIPDDWQHVEDYPLTALARNDRPTRVPVVLGVNWYSEFDDPQLDERTGEHFVARRGAASLTRIRGGHCICLEPGGEPDTDDWWSFYNQGKEGACVGFGWSRCMTILNAGSLYSARWLWDRAKERDQWPETKPGDDNGTSVRTAGGVLRKTGHVPWKANYTDDDHNQRGAYKPELEAGIQHFRWARSVDVVHEVLANDRADERGAVPFLNSWGREYPHRTWMPDDVLDRLIAEDGEIAVPTDR
jgi:hypothetical protein